MNKKKVYVHILPQNKEGFNEGDLCQCIKSEGDDKIGDLYIAKATFRHSNEWWQVVNMVITDDSTIQEGDTFYVGTQQISGGPGVKECTAIGENGWEGHIITKDTDHRGYHPSHCKKVIAMNNHPSLPGISKEDIVWWIENGQPSEMSIEAFIWDEINQDTGVVETTLKPSLDENNCIVLHKSCTTQVETVEEAANRLFNNASQGNVMKATFKAGAHGKRNSR